MRTDCVSELREEVAAEKVSEADKEGVREVPEEDAHKRSKRGPLAIGRNRRGYQAAYLFAR